MDKKVTLDSIDLEQSAYYILHGAEFVSARQVPVQRSKFEKLGSVYLFKIELNNIDPHDMKVWRDGNAQAPVIEFMKIRRKLKKQIKDYLGIR